MSSLSLFLSISLLLLLSTTSAARFPCTAKNPSTCQSLIGYVPPNATTLGAVRALFQLRSFRSILAANSLPLSTPASYPVQEKTTVRVRLPCYCSGGSGSSFGLPVYKVRAGDGLDGIARGVFSGLVSYEEIAKANNISDPNKVEVGQQIKIPLPCSCDLVGGEAVVHYAHVVMPASSVSGIAAGFGTTEDILMRLNGISDPKTLQAGQVLDIPLKPCSSSISKQSLDRNLRVPNGSYILTANNCVQCSCSASTWQLDCQPTQGISSSACPTAKCGDLFLGNSSTGPNACDNTACSYAGYTNTTSFTILTNLTTQDICSSSAASPTALPTTSTGLGLELSSWVELLVLLHMALLCLVEKI